MKKKKYNEEVDKEVFDEVVEEKANEVFAKRVADDAQWKGDKVVIEHLLQSKNYVLITESEYKTLVKRKIKK